MSDENGLKVRVRKDGFASSKRRQYTVEFMNDAGRWEIIWYYGVKWFAMRAAKKYKRTGGTEYWYV